MYKIQQVCLVIFVRCMTALHLNDLNPLKIKPLNCSSACYEYTEDDSHSQILFWRTDKSKFFFQYTIIFSSSPPTHYIHHYYYVYHPMSKACFEV